MYQSSDSEQTAEDVIFMFPKRGSTCGPDSVMLKTIEDKDRGIKQCGRINEQND